MQTALKAKKLNPDSDTFPRIQMKIAKVFFLKVSKNTL